MDAAPSQVTLLPMQLRRLAELADEYGCAIGIFQDGSTLTVNTGSTKFRMNAKGEPIETDVPHTKLEAYLFESSQLRTRPKPQES